MACVTPLFNEIYDRKSFHGNLVAALSSLSLKIKEKLLFKSQPFYLCTFAPIRVRYLTNEFCLQLDERRSVAVAAPQVAVAGRDCGSQGPPPLAEC